MRVILVGGPSGGHIFPALGLIDALRVKDKRIEVLLVLPKSGINIRFNRSGYDLVYILTDSIKASLDFKNFFAILKFLISCAQSLLIIVRFRPDAMVGFGSLNSIPLILWARFFRVKTLIHEQNVIPGRANKLLSSFTQQIAISFEKTRDYLKGNQRKIIFTGNPLRKELIKMDKSMALECLGLEQGKFTLLVTGGSQGSHNINLAFFQAICESSLKSVVQIIHICGKKDFEELKQKYLKASIKAKLFSFLEEMQYAYSASDLVISRSGATSIAEIMFYRLLAILIPYPFAYQHQVENARVLEDLGVAEIIYDQELDSGKLRCTLERLISRPDYLKTMSSGYQNISRQDSGHLLAEAILAL